MIIVEEGYLRDSGVFRIGMGGNIDGVGSI